MAIICKGTATIPGATARQLSLAYPRPVELGLEDAAPCLLIAAGGIAINRRLLASILAASASQRKQLIERALARFEWWINDRGEVYRVRACGADRPIVHRVPGPPPGYQ